MSKWIPDAAYVATAIGKGVKVQRLKDGSAAVWFTKASDEGMVMINKAEVTAFMENRQATLLAMEQQALTQTNEMPHVNDVATGYGDE